MTKPRIKKKSAFKAGMYLLETLTAGMYNDPLAIYREYIQNAADSIDIALKTNPISSKRIQINLDPTEKSITICDEGMGIPSGLAEDILSSIGLSSKMNQKLRGFRGIGRLGGLAFCDHAVFRTKAMNEQVESIQEWDCTNLRYLMSNQEKSTFSLNQLFNKATNFYQKNGQIKSGSYFEVKLYGVQSFRNHIMDIKKVYDYLSVTAPVPINSAQFSFTKEINSYLSSNVNDYFFYDIILNGEPVYKPYRDNIKLTSKGYDIIEGIETFDIMVNGTPAAYGWYGKRRELLGAVTKSEMSSGIRVRVGNIQVGDNHLLDGCYRENRFNSYIVGEIHVVCEDLIPNSRRDDFVDNEAKGLFYDAVERELGLNFSKEIRLSSRLKSKNGNLISRNVEPDNNHPINVESLVPFEYNKSPEKKPDLFAVFKRECKDCPVLKKITEMI